MHPPLDRLRGTVGVWTVTHESVRPSALAGLAGAVERAGFSALWVPEAWGREAMTGAQLLLVATTSLVVATGIATIQARDAMATANAAKTLAEASGGRFVLGLGTSHRPLVERGRRGTYEPPVAAMGRFLGTLGTVPDFAAEHDVEVPVVLAALGPRMLALAAAHADGALSYLVTAEHTELARRALGPDRFLAVELSVVLGQGRDEYLRRAHEHLNLYTGLDGYRSSWRRLGFDESDFVRGGSERLCDALVVHGDPDVIAEAVAGHVAAGADHVCLQVLGATLTDPPLDGWEALGERFGPR